MRVIDDCKEPYFKFDTVDAAYFHCFRAKTNIVNSLIPE